jgi:hypothetical protein
VPENKTITTQSKLRAFSAILYLILIISLVSIVTISLFLPATQAGNIDATDFGVYQDKLCKDSIQQVSWGAINTGSSVSQTIYIRNERSTACYLSIATSKWNPPAASNYISLKWNYSGQKIQANEVIPIKLTLNVTDGTEIAGFSFNIIITSAQ